MRSTFPASSALRRACTTGPAMESRGGGTLRHRLPPRRATGEQNDDFEASFRSSQTTRGTLVVVQTTRQGGRVTFTVDVRIGDLVAGRVDERRWERSGCSHRCSRGAAGRAVGFPCRRGQRGRWRRQRRRGGRGRRRVVDHNWHEGVVRVSHDRRDHSIREAAEVRHVSHDRAGRECLVRPRLWPSAVADRGPPILQSAGARGLRRRRRVSRDLRPRRPPSRAVGPFNEARDRDRQRRPNDSQTILWLGYDRRRQRLVCEGLEGSCQRPCYGDECAGPPSAVTRCVRPVADDSP